MRKFLKIAVIVCFIVFLVYMGINCSKKSKEEKENGQNNVAENENAEKEETKIPVKVSIAVKGDLPLRISITGTTEAREKAVVKSKIEGFVKNIFHREGDKVEKGETIVKLDSKAKKLALEEAEATRLEKLSRFVTEYSYVKESAESENKTKEIEKKMNDYLKVLDLFKKGKISKTQLSKTEKSLLESMVKSGIMQYKVQKAVSGLTQAEIALERARYDYENMNIRAPFSGVISEIKIPKGQRINAGTEVFKIIDLDSIYLKGQILETEISKIKKEQTVNIKLIAYPDKVLRGIISAVSPEIDPEKKTGTIFVDFKNPGFVKVGMDAEIFVEFQILEDVIKVPRKALIVREGRPLVFVVEDNDTAMWRYIDLGAKNEDEIEIKSGVEENELVVIEGHKTLAHQSKVKIVE